MKTMDWEANVAKGACPECGGDIYLAYKQRKGEPPRLSMCIKCSRVYPAMRFKQNKIEEGI